MVHGVTWVTDDSSGMAYDLCHEAYSPFSLGVRGYALPGRNEKTKETPPASATNHATLPISSRSRLNNHTYEDKWDSVIPRKSDALLVRLGMSPEEALELRDNVRALFVVELEPPYAYNWDDYSSPTFTSPSLYTYHEHVLYARPIALWFFNSKTGVILRQISISPSQSAPNQAAAAKPGQFSNTDTLEAKTDALGKQGDAGQSLRNNVAQQLTHGESAARAEGQVLIWTISPPTGMSPEDFAAAFKKRLIVGADGESNREKLRSYGFTQICLETDGKSFEWPINKD
jgi:hypothetical protein